MIKFLLSLLFILISCPSIAFTCVSPNGTISYGGGTADVYVKIKPVLKPNENIIIDLTQPGSLIECINDYPNSHVDTFWPVTGTQFAAGTEIKNGTINWFGHAERLPVNSDAQFYPFTFHLRDYPWHTLKVKFTLQPVGNAGGTIIKKGSTIGIFRYKQINNFHEQNYYTWRIRASNDVIIPHGTCEANAYDTQVTLNNYNKSKSSRAPINLSVHCGTPTNLSYSLEGKLESNTDNSVFKNTAVNPAKGIGISFFNDGKKINRFDVQKLGTVDNSYKSLNLSADYGVIKGVPLSAGYVKSEVTVNITYS
ncbi:fimbrial protein [Photobacterium leiognathi]|uniref:fimbrial protein n=1 Tax=Photobacterium leiognathi TaxID=553611 RepID=UPI002980D08C|nr:fimbrial protein [Photobacterium leiognathi]